MKGEPVITARIILRFCCVIRWRRSDRPRESPSHKWQLGVVSPAWRFSARPGPGERMWSQKKCNGRDCVRSETNKQWTVWEARRKNSELCKKRDKQTVRWVIRELSDLSRWGEGKIKWWLRDGMVATKVKPRTLVLTNNQWSSKRKKYRGDSATNCCVMRRMYWWWSKKCCAMDAKWHDGALGNRRRRSERKRKVHLVTTEGASKKAYILGIKKSSLSSSKLVINLDWYCHQAIIGWMSSNLINDDALETGEKSRKKNHPIG